MTPWNHKYFVPDGKNPAVKTGLSYITLPLFFLNPLLCLLLNTNLWLLCHKTLPVINTLLSQKITFMVRSCMLFTDGNNRLIASNLTLTKSRTESMTAGCGAPEVAMIKGSEADGTTVSFMLSQSIKGSSSIWFHIKGKAFILGLPGQWHK